MSRGVNKVILVGNLGADPEFRANAGVNVCKIRVATTENWKDRESGEMNEKTEWHRVTAFGRTAEVMRDYLGQGSMVYIEGRLQTSKWQDPQGQDRYSTDIIASNMVMLGGRSGGGSSPRQGADQGPGDSAQSSQSSAGQSEPDLNDDIPF